MKSLMTDQDLTRKVFLKCYQIGEVSKKISQSSLNVGDYLIDDREANGAGKLGGKRILFGSAHCPDWASAERLLADV